ncbi:MAG: phosphopentomutase [Angelakisella sp.]
MSKRVFLIVLDSVGIGEMADSAEYGDAGSNTLAACATSDKFHVPTLRELGIFNIDEVGCGDPVEHPVGSFCRLAESSKGKDTTIGHWEIAGIISESPLPTYPNGFPKEILDKLTAATGRGILCNLPYSGTAVLDDFGEQHMKTGDLIVYTSADSVLQIAAHEEIVPIAELYKICEMAREIMSGEHGVGRIIARPFLGTPGSFMRTSNRHDYSLLPPAPTLLDALCEHGMDSIGVGKINDIFAGKGISSFVRTKSNFDGMNKTIEYAARDFHGLCFVNLVDFDMVYGHRNNVEGYATALTEFDKQLAELLPLLQPEDVLIITADHGCDPSTPSTDHSREHTPMLIVGDTIRHGVNLGTQTGFCNIAATIADYLEVKADIKGQSFLKQVIK